jgi:hypothetical protein
MKSDVVTVFSTGRLGLLAYAKSVRDGERIHYVMKGELLQNLFGLGSLGCGSQSNIIELCHYRELRVRSAYGNITSTEVVRA